MLVPLNVDVPMDRWPWANWAVLVATVLLSAALFSVDGESDLFSMMVLQREDFRFVQLVGHLYAHADILHLLGNMVFLFCFGNAVNAKLGHLWYLALYHVLGAMAGLGWLALGNGLFLVGASGAIMGVVGAFVVFFPKNEVKLFYWFGWFWRGTADISAYWVIGLYVAFDLWGLATAGKGDAVAYVAHVFGAAAGAGAAIGLLKLGFAQPNEHEQNLLQVLAERRGTPSRPSITGRQVRAERFETSAGSRRTGIAQPPPRPAAHRPESEDASPMVARRNVAATEAVRPPIPVDPPIAGPSAGGQASAARGVRPPTGRRPPGDVAKPTAPTATRGRTPASEAGFTPSVSPDPYDIR